MDRFIVAKVFLLDGTFLLYPLVRMNCRLEIISNCSTNVGEVLFISVSKTRTEEKYRRKGGFVSDLKVLQESILNDRTSLSASQGQ